MNKWQEIARIRQERINELKDDNQRLRSQLSSKDDLISRWESIVEDYKELVTKLK